MAQKDVGTLIVDRKWFWVSGDAEANGWTTERWYKAVVGGGIESGVSMESVEYARAQLLRDPRGARRSTQLIAMVIVVVLQVGLRDPFQMA